MKLSEKSTKELVEIILRKDDVHRTLQNDYKLLEKHNNNLLQALEVEKEQVSILEKIINTQKVCFFWVSAIVFLLVASLSVVRLIGC